MKLNEIYTRNILVEEDGIQLYAEHINESAINVGILQTSGGLVKNATKGFSKFAKNHPFITGAMAAYGIDALKKYQKNKRNTIKFYTKDLREKKLYKDMIDQLMKSGKYRLEKNTYIDGGYLFVLKRLGG